MNVAEGILFGFLFFGILYLYVKTRKIWNWKKITKILMISSIASAIFLTVVGFTIKYYNDYEDTHTVATEIAGMKLGQSYSSLVFENGGEYGTYDHDDEGDLDDDGDNTPFWINNETSKVATIENDTVIDIGVYCNKTTYFLKGIYCGDDSEKIIRKFGKDIEVYCPKKEYLYITRQKSNDKLKEEIVTDSNEKSKEDSTEKSQIESKNDTPFELALDTERDYAEEESRNRTRTINSYKERFYVNKKLGIMYYLYENRVSMIKVVRLNHSFLNKKRYVPCSHN